MHQATHDGFHWLKDGACGGGACGSGATHLDKLGKPESYLDYIHLPGLSSLPFVVTTNQIRSSNKT